MTKEELHENLHIRLRFVDSMIAMVLLNQTGVYTEVKSPLPSKGKMRWRIGGKNFELGTKPMQDALLTSGLIATRNLYNFLGIGIKPDTIILKIYQGKNDDFVHSSIPGARPLDLDLFDLYAESGNTVVVDGANVPLRDVVGKVLSIASKEIAHITRNSEQKLIHAGAFVCAGTLLLIAVQELVLIPVYGETDIHLSRHHTSVLLPDDLSQAHRDMIDRCREDFKEAISQHMLGRASEGAS